MKLAKKFLRRPSSKSNSDKWVYRCAAPEVERVITKVVEGVTDSASDFNEAAFLEYDPTPYGGGYDITLTYGNPLPPSDAICYSHSDWDPDSRNLEEFLYGSVIAPYGQEPVKVDHEKPQNGSGFTHSSVEEKAQNGKELVPVDHGKPQNGSGLTHSFEDEKPFYGGNGYRDGNCLPSYGCDFWVEGFFSYGNGYDNGYDGRDHEKAMIPYQGEEESYGYGMEEPQAGDDSDTNWVQSCEDLFGGWLWPSTVEGDTHKPQDADKPSNGNQWNGTADYVFGFSYPYGEGRDESHSYGNPIYSYAKHSHMQPYHVLVEYQEPSWTTKPTYYQTYEEEVSVQTEYDSLHERHSHEELQYDHSNYSETSWFREPDYYEAYQEEAYTGPKYGDDSYGERW